MMNKKYSEKAAFKVVNGMLDYCRRHEKRELLQYSWIDSEGRQCALNGYIAFRLASPLEGLPEMPDGETPIDLARVFPRLDGLRELQTPDAAEVAALIAYDRQHDSRRRYMYSFGPGLPVVNSLYLRDMLTVYPDARFYFSNIISPVLVISEHGDGVILPIRVATDEMQQRREIIYNLSTFAQRFAA